MTDNHSHGRLFADLVSGDRTLSGDELAERVSRLASALVEMNLRPGDNVAILMRNDFAFLELTMAAQRVGIVAIPLNWHGNGKEVGFILNDSNAKALFVHADLLAPVRDHIPANCRVVRAQTPPEVIESYRIDPTHLLDARATDIAYEEWRDSSPPYSGDMIMPPRRILYTSGTTGNPKGVIREIPDPDILQKFGMRGMQAFGLDAQPIRAVMTGPLYHSAPEFYGQTCVRFGELLVLQPRFSAEGLLDIIERHRISHLHAVPTMFNRLLNIPEERRRSFDHSTLEAVVHGAAACPPHIKRAMIEWWGPIIREYYAATEVGIITCSTSEEWLANPGTVGRAPDASIAVGIFDEQGCELPAGETGEIMFKTDLRDFVSYHGRPEADAELKPGDWMTLGDLGYINEEGYLWISDRKKDMVISGGVNIFPIEIEDVLLAFEGVSDAIVFGVADDDLGEVLVAFIQPQEGSVLSVDEILAMVRKELGKLKTPKTVRMVERLPREDSGKIARRKLKTEFLGNR
jgi:long-chain acyl-CoA synthetase